MVKLSDLKVGTRVAFRYCSNCGHIFGVMHHINRDGICDSADQKIMPCKVTDFIKADFLQVSVKALREDDIIKSFSLNMETVCDVTELEYID